MEYISKEQLQALYDEDAVTMKGWAMIKQMPTIDIVRCSECVYWGDADGKLQRSDGVEYARCTVHNYVIDGRHTGWCPTENDFCSYGERRTDG